MVEIGQLKILIIEDDISESTDLLVKLDALQVFNVKCVDNFEDSISEINLQVYNLVFVDVILNGEQKGSELAHLLSLNDISFIITTKYTDLSYFQNITKYNPIAYFQKPVDPLALRFRLEELANSLNDQKSDFIFHRIGTEYKRFEKSNINYIEGEGNYVSIYTDDDKILLRHSLKAFVLTLDSSKFIQIHRKWVVRLDKIDSVNTQKNIVSMGDKIFPVGRTFQSKLVKHLRS